MARQKMTDEQKKKRDEKSVAKQKAENLARDLDDLYKKYTPEPTFQFEVGQRVQHGAITKSIVSEVIEGGKFYKLHEVCTENNYGKPYDYERDAYVAWHDLEFYRTPEEEDAIPSLVKDKDIHITYSQMGIDSILSKRYSSYAGIEMNPPYQRGNVWTGRDKALLIHSIFNNVEIGKFAFIQRREGEVNDPYYEILDGKQRVTALCEFYENRFPYMGYYFRDLNWRDRHHFESYPVAVAMTRNLTEEQKYRYFLKMNIAGVPQDDSHIRHVEKLLGELKK